MTESPEDDIALIELGLRRKGDEYFVQARRPGDSQHAEYGPMPEQVAMAFIEALKRTVAALDGAVDRANLDDILESASKQVTKPN